MHVASNIEPVRKKKAFCNDLPSESATISCSSGDNVYVFRIDVRMNLMSY